MKTHTYLSSDLKEIGKITRGQSFHHEGKSKYKGKQKGQCEDLSENKR